MGFKRRSSILRRQESTTAECMDPRLPGDDARGFDRLCQMTDRPQAQWVRHLRNMRPAHSPKSSR
jgi:hypothetical protein